VVWEGRSREASPYPDANHKLYDDPMLRLTIGAILVLLRVNAQPVQESPALRAFPVCATAKGYYVIAPVSK
jgi:hypothetical protein